MAPATTAKVVRIIVFGTSTSTPIFPCATFFAVISSRSSGRTIMEPKTPAKIEDQIIPHMYVKISNRNSFAKKSNLEKKVGYKKRIKTKLVEYDDLRQFGIRKSKMIE